MTTRNDDSQMKKNQRRYTFGQYVDQVAPEYRDESTSKLERMREIFHQELKRIENERREQRSS